jgi:hypothetical protein
MRSDEPYIDGGCKLGVNLFLICSYVAKGDMLFYNILNGDVVR